MNKISPQLKYTKKYGIYTLVTNHSEYNEMVESAKRAGFKDENVEFYYFDNSKNEYDGYSGLNYAIKNSEEEYVIFCHQDILFKFDKYEKLNYCLNILNNFDQNWAIAGNAGKDKDGEMKIRISDPHGENQSKGRFPAEVISLDENFLIINNKFNISCSNQLSGFHFYGLDLCSNAIYLGLKCYVIDFHIQHKSSGSLNKLFYESKLAFIKMQEKRLSNNYYSTTCTNIYIGSNRLFNYFINKRYFINFYMFFRKNIFNWKNFK